ncbi:MAG: DUF3536 domain-containing protein [Myxococcota bacterium]
MRHLCIHGHFYQPPRENPWLESVELQDSAYPFHDWNERIAAECYGANAASRILDEDGWIVGIVNNYKRISFNFGATLLAWMEHARPDVYRRILAADVASRERFSGHGSALAQAYNHSILPLCTPRDRVTQVRWGIADFVARFGRRPEGMWLPETAVDTPTLEALAAEGIAFTLLAPHQAARVRPRGDKGWHDVSGARVDPRRPYQCRLPSGRSIALFFYDGPVSSAVAFEHLLSNGDKFKDRLTGAFDARDEPQLVHIATDGESYGHHHRHGNMALAYALQEIEADPGVTLTNYGEFLDKHPPTWEVEIAENTSWSCAHGIERWRSDCGCCTGGRPDWNQRWRAPLRAALDFLAERIAAVYEAEGPPLLRSIWEARDAYADVILDRSPRALDRFFETHAAGPLSADDRTRALRLLEMQRQSLLMYTSCGWFFDELSGIETVQILRYAGRAIQLVVEVGGEDLGPEFARRLAEARSNLPEHGDGARLFAQLVTPKRIDLSALVAHYAVSSLFHPYTEKTRIHAFEVEQLDFGVQSLGRNKLAVGKVRVTSEVTLEQRTLSFGILHLGDHNLAGGVREFQGDDDYEVMCEEVLGAFARADMPEALRLLDKHFLELTYSLRSLFRDERQRVLDQIVGSAMLDAEGLSGRLYDAHSPLLRYLATLDFPLPEPLRRLADFVLGTMLRRELQQDELDPARVQNLLAEAEGVGAELDRVGAAFGLQTALERTIDAWGAHPEELTVLRRLRGAAELARSLPWDIELAKVQNVYWDLLQGQYPKFVEQADAGDPIAMEWRDNFLSLGAALRMRTGQ